MVSLRLLVFISVVCGSQANHFAGPFMIWGMNKLQPKISTLQRNKIFIYHLIMQIYH